MVLNFIYVVHSHALGAVECVQFNDDTVLGQAANGGADTAGSGQIDVALAAHLLNGAGLNDGPVNLSQIALTELGGQVGEVEVAVCHLVLVHAFAEVGICGVGSTEVDCLCVGKHSVATLACAGAREDTDLEGTAGCVLGFGLLCNLCGGALGCSCGCESTQTDGLSVLNKRGGFGCGDFLE